MTEAGPIEGDRTSVRSEAYSLPEQFVWDNVNLLDDLQVCENILVKYMYMYSTRQNKCTIITVYYNCTTLQ